MSQTSPVTEIAEGMEALREIEVAWLSRELGRAISNLAYPVGCGAAPADYHLEAAAKALFERYAKMIEMARTAGLAQCQQQPIAWRWRIKNANGNASGWALQFHKPNISKDVPHDEEPLYALSDTSTLGNSK